MQHDKAWQVELLRMSFFFEMKERDKWTSIWTAITEQSVDSTTEKHNLMQIVEEGIWNNHLLTVALQSNRIDILWSAKELEGSLLPSLGDFSDLADSFKEAVIKVLSKDRLYSIQRAGFGAILLNPVETKEQAYSLLENYLPTVKISQNSRDFLYQINRPIVSRFNTEREINRLSKWHAVQAKYVNFQQDSFGILANACRLELDINSSVDKLYSEDQPIELEEISEFTSFALNIATNGDLE